VLEAAELEKVAASVHHEGIVILAQERPFLDEDSLAARLSKAPTGTAALYFDGVKNPHNIGSILRVAAHFGVPAALGRQGELSRLTPAALRVAEGGAEHVELCPLAQPEKTLPSLAKAGWPLIATSSHEGQSLYETKLPHHAIFAVGNEVSGMSPKLMRSADLLIKIPGTGAVESLNVAACASILLAEHWRQHHGKRP
jgi:TrmH RNA methyltransferase